MPTPQKVEDWQAPWEKKGEDVDADKVKAFTHSLLIREEKAIAEATSAKSALEASETEKQTLQGKLDQATAAGGEQAQQLQARVTELESQIAEGTTKAKTDAELRDLRFEIGLARGLTAKQARKLEGATREELEADADETFGKPGDDDGDEQPRVRPRSLHNHGDPDGTSTGWDQQKALDSIPRQ